MKRITLLIAFLFSVITAGYGQVAGYSFSQSTGNTYTEITGGTALVTCNACSTAYDAETYAITLPTSFPYNGTAVTSVVMRVDGSLLLGTSTTNSTTPISSSTTGTGVISPLGMDLRNSTVGGVYELRWEDTGTNYVFQWKNASRWNQETVERLDFQVSINKATGVINFNYGAFTGVANSTGYQPQVGLRGSANTDFNNRVLSINVPDFTPSWDDTASSWSNSSTVRFTSGAPAAVVMSGLRFTYTPAVACSGTPAGGSVAGFADQFICGTGTPSAISIMNANPAAPGITFQWEQSTDGGTTWSNAVGGSGATTLSYSPPTFAGTAIRYRLKTTCANSALTATSSVSTVNPIGAPTVQSSSITLSGDFATGFTASWTNGSGARRLVYVSDSPITDPVSGTAIPAYTPNAAYSGTGQKLVYEGTGSSVTVGGLGCGVYYVKVFEYNRCGSGPYDVYFNTTSGSNSATKAVTPAVALPSANNFTGFTGSNLLTAVPGWYEAAIVTAAGATPTTANPAGLTSSWTSSTAFTATTARVNLTSNTKNEWIISPKLAIAAASRVKFKAAITNNTAATANATGMQGTDDKVFVMITTDCGATWTPLYTFSAANTTTLTNALTDFIVVIPSSYIGQTVQVGFQATEGPVDDTPSYDFHISNVIVEAIPSCEKPVLTATTNITKNSATINWNAPTLGVPTGYQYVVSTSNTTPVAAGTAVTGTTANVTSLAPLTTYYVFVRTACGSDFSDWSLSGTFGTLCDYGSVTASTPATRCGAGNITLNATASAGSAIQWFDAATGGNLVGSASALTTNVNATTTFYATSATALAGTATVGTGASLTDPVEVLTAFNNRFAAYRMQIVYTVADLNAAGLAAGNITSLAFRTTTLGDGATNANYTVKMGTIATATIPSTTFVASGLTTVYGPVTHTHTASGWQVINLTTPYVWNGTSNIIVEVSHAGADLINNAVTYYTSTTGNTVLYSTGVDPVTGTLAVKRPDIMFAGQTYCRSPRTAVVATVNAPPALTLSTPAAVCAGQSTAPVTIVTGAGAYDVFTWTPSTGVAGNAATGWTFNPAVSTVYTLQASQSAGTLCNAAPVTVSVTIGQIPSAASISSSPVAVCEGQSQPLTLSGGLTAASVAYGNGTTAPSTTSYPNPFSAYYGGTKTQILFTAAELQAQGIVSGTVINSLSFDFFASSAFELNDMRIKLGATANDNLTAGVVPSTGLTTVYNASYTPTANATGLVAFTLTTPFNYSGGNLVVEIAHNAGNGGNGSGTRTKTTATTFDSVYTQAKDNVAGNVAGFDGEATYSVGSASTLRPNIVFGAGLPNAVTWAPVTSLYTDAAATVAYTGQPALTVYVKPTGALTYTATATTAIGCTSSATVNVTVTVIAAPTVAAATQEFCNSGTVAGLTATGTAIKWYAAATGGTALAATTALVNNTTYYASQTVNGCESVARTALTAVINVIAAPTVADDTQEFCNAGTVAELLPNDASIKWYSVATGGTALASTDALASGSYYASQTVNGCEGLTRTLVTVTVNVIAAAPINAAAQEFCNAATVADLLPNDASIKWYADATGGTALASTEALVDGTTYYASQTIGTCEGLVRGAVTATINVTAAPTGDSEQEFCSAATVAQLTATGDNITWYDAAIAGNIVAADAALVNGTTYYASQTIDTCEGLTRFGVTAVIHNVVADAPADVNECYSYVLPVLTSGAYFTEAGGLGTEVAAGTAIEETTTLYVYATEGTDIVCSDENSFVITIANIAAPTGDSPQTVSVTDAADATIADIVVTAQGTVTWYATEADAAAGTNPLAADTQLTQGATYYATQTVGTCESANALAVTVDVVLGDKGFDVKAFTFYPNPVKDVLNISYSSDITSVTVFNLLGQQVITLAPNSADVKLDMSALADAAYIVNVTAGNTVKTIKVIKRQ
ncbi:T9SS type A sorting domain-containing protein [Flavobacterium sp. DG1-102-2]|uniref:beta strand repeat-containing protein n=1 Tax=Flavobacterium sp. DG1-102-2 TaxID=3081663 RepID=UPI002948D39F|nr:T9SS type A sorting domain-containing protein [Flavobacterium sp. DG1-102-2]MDV6169968.1 T9SS type A sorting domain-containing protein [Flavobacterium sp. DG1-102-2]